MPTCRYCGTAATLTRDHIIPRSAAVPWQSMEPALRSMVQARNIAMACGRCNHAKANLLPGDATWSDDARRRSITGAVQRVASSVIALLLQSVGHSDAILEIRNRIGVPTESPAPGPACGWLRLHVLTMVYQGLASPAWATEAELDALDAGWSPPLHVSLRPSTISAICDGRSAHLGAPYRRGDAEAMRAHDQLRRERDRKRAEKAAAQSARSWERRRSVVSHGESIAVYRIEK